MLSLVLGYIFHGLTCSHVGSLSRSLFKSPYSISCVFWTCISLNWYLNVFICNASVDNLSYRPPLYLYLLSVVIPVRKSLHLCDWWMRFFFSRWFWVNFVAWHRTLRTVYSCRKCWIEWCLEFLQPGSMNWSFQSDSAQAQNQHKQHDPPTLWHSSE